MADRSSSTGATKQRRYRARKDEGILVVSVEVPLALREKFVECGWVKDVEADNKTKVGSVLIASSSWAAGVQSGEKVLRVDPFGPLPGLGSVLGGKK